LHGDIEVEKMWKTGLIALAVFAFLLAGCTNTPSQQVGATATTSVGNMQYNPYVSYDVAFTTNRTGSTSTINDSIQIPNAWGQLQFVHVKNPNNYTVGLANSNITFRIIDETGNTAFNLVVENGTTSTNRSMNNYTIYGFMNLTAINMSNGSTVVARIVMKK